MMKKQRLRWVSAMLAAVMTFSICATPVDMGKASAHWADSSMTRLRDWGIMRGDQNGSMEPDRNITRAEFVSMVNRAFGYKTTGKMPFKDVDEEDWYANDINIGYNQGYFMGSSKSTASPNNSLTREEAITLIGRNLMFTPDYSENLVFTDGRELSSWSRPIVNAAAKKGIVRGDSEGTFRPHDPITRGEVASLLDRTIGTPLNKPGKTSLGMVNGNVMISSSGVELTDTVINGDLYITAGVGLGFVNLNNVKVNGQVIASGAGVSNRDTDSVTMRNCTINELIIDSPNNVAISMHAEGNTRIGKTYVRTDSYLEDTTYGDNGFQYIEVDGEEGTRVDMTGDFMDVVLKAPRGTVALGRGSIRKLTVDEQAQDARVIIDVDALIREVYLDAPTTITGAGDIGYLKVNVNGCKVSMLPDKIEIRPGVIANINGQNMTSKDAELASTYPRILAGYPKIDDIGPNAANAMLNTNKTGTIYWGITLKEDDALTSEELITPPSYGDKSVVMGTSNVKTAEEDFITQISSLKPDTEYIYSVVLKDSRGDNSAVKTRVFRTPDNSIPNFASGYPKLSWDGYRDEEARTNYGADIEFVATKISKVCWAVYKKGLPAPTADELRTQTMTGHVKGANGVNNALKNEPGIINVNGLEEVTEYDMYLMLTDGINHSPVKKFSFKTADKTPPEIIKGPSSDNIKEKSVDVKLTVNEDATVYWVAVKRGDTYPVPPDDWEGGSVPLDSDEAKSQVMSGSNAFKSGKINVTGEKEGKFTISGLEAQTGYDVYILPVDKAGNMAKTVVMLPVRTLDVIPPTALLKFDPDVNGQPMVDSNISIVFSEEVRVEVDEDGKRKSLHEMVGQELLDAVKRNFTFFDMEYIVDNEMKLTDDPSLIECVLDEQKTVLTFKPGAIVDLLSGNKYKVVLNKNIYDTANNKLDPDSRELLFTTVYSQIAQKKLNDVPEGRDAAFELRPQSTKVAESIYFDLVFWSTLDVEFELYQRDEGETEWKQVMKRDEDGQTTSIPVLGKIGKNEATTLYQMIDGKNPKFEKLKDFKDTRSYAIKVTKVGGEPVEEVNTFGSMYTVPVAGYLNVMQQLSNNPKQYWEQLIGNGVTMIGSPSALELLLVFADTQVPKFINEYPKFNAGDSIIMPEVMVDRKATLYYTVAPKGAITITADGELPEDGSKPMPNILKPTPEQIVNGAFKGVVGAVIGSYNGANDDGIVANAVNTFKIEGLQPTTEYEVFFVLKGAAPGYSQVYAYTVKTSQVKTPDFMLENSIATVDSNTVSVKVTEQSKVWYKVYRFQELPDQIKNAEDVLKPNSKSSNFSMVLEGDATEEQKKLVAIAELLQGQVGSDGAVESGEKEIMGVPSGPGGWITEPVQLKNLEPKKTYVMVGLAQNLLGGDFVLYRLDDIEVRDGIPPRIASVNGPDLSGQTGPFYSGTVTITFTEPLFFQKPGNNKEWFPVGKDQLRVTDSDTPGEHMIFVPGSDHGKVTFMGQTPSEGQGVLTMIYSFSNAKVGETTLQFPYQITDKEGNPVPNGGNFRIHLQISTGQDGEGIEAPRFVATLGDQVEIMRIR